MVCPACGLSTNALGACSSCGSVLTASHTATGVLALDTTGLPPGAVRHPATSPTDLPTGEILEGALPTLQGPLHVGQSFGPRYHIIKLLGVGGMGAVYQAWDAELGVAVALKVIRRRSRDAAASSEAEKRFKNELLLARQVTHKNVVRIHDLGEIDGIKYITMPYIKGEDLASTLRRDGALAVPLALKIARQLAAGLEAAHEAGVVHRDLKPANIMITVRADDVHAEIMDFGISASNADAMSGGLVGTLEYMAPEQGAGVAVDARADIYAFGLILYEMLTGPRQLVARTPAERFELMQHRTRDGLPAARAIDPSLSPELDAFVSRCLERDAAARFQSSAEMTRALARLDDHGALIPEARRLTPRMMVSVAAIVTLLLGGTYFVAQWQNQVAAPHDPVSVVIADFENQTADPAFDRTLEPMLRRALEGAGFISAYDRSTVSRTLGVQAPERFTDAAARELAQKQGLGIVLAGFIAPQGDGYRISMNASETVTGKVVSAAQGTAASRDQVLGVATKLVSSVRTALGDSTSESQQMFAMTSLSATSLDVVRHYAAAQDAAANARFEAAHDEMLKAVAIDPTFGIGYQLLAVASRNLGKMEDSERYIQQALRYVDRMTERERYSTRGFYYRISGDYQKCVDEYGELIKRYQADVIGHNQRALCLSQLRHLKEAVDEMRQVVAIVPKRLLFRDNLVLYRNYAGDFQGAEQDANAIETPDAYALLGRAFSLVARDQRSAASSTYKQLAALDPVGASIAASGLGDLAAVEGRFADATALLRAGARHDTAAGRTERAAAKLLSVAGSELARGNQQSAIDAARQALAASKLVKVRFLAARIFVEAGEIASARPLIDGLESELQAEPQAYAKILEGLALIESDPRHAIRTIEEGNRILDTWIGRFYLGRAYLSAGLLPQADSEFDRCLNRRGEALALFLDEEPTYAFLPPVYYYQGRVREGLKTANFADSYRSYLAIRGSSREDRLAADARRRIGS